MTKSLKTVRRPGDQIVIGQAVIRFVTCERGRVRIEVEADETVKIQIKPKKVLQSANISI